MYNKEEDVEMRTTQEEEHVVTREQKLLDKGWRILASVNGSIFVVESPYSDVQVLHFYFDAASNTPMVEGYFTTSFGFKARNELLNDPEKFIGNFYLHTSVAEPDWCTQEEYLLR
jgi:hypothetical protein